VFRSDLAAYPVRQVWEPDGVGAGLDAFNGSAFWQIRGHADPAVRK
jgi:hypothetical protein